jgi:hypothetical protein
VLNCDWGWYLTNPDDASWRARFAIDLAAQLRSTHADGAFLDSASVPSYLGASRFSPPLPAVDAAFETAWSRRIERWLAFLHASVQRPLVPNVGSWVTTRDRTDYSGADGAMVEGFALGLAPGDWALQLDRVLGLVRRDRIVIAQAYPDVDDVRARTFALASYLLVRGEHTYLNFEVSSTPEWFPEYDLALGPAAAPPRRASGSCATAPSMSAASRTGSPSRIPARPRPRSSRRPATSSRRRRAAAPSPPTAGHPRPGGSCGRRSPVSAWSRAAAPCCSRPCAGRPRCAPSS